VIERIERSNLDGNATPSQLVEQPRSSHKGPPKWLIKTLESVHPGEVGKTRTMSSTRQDGGDVDDMDVSYDCELNLSTKFEPTFFEEVASHDEWKEAMQKEYDALIKNEYKSDGSLYKHKERLVAKRFVHKEGIDYEETFSPVTWATICSLFSLAT
jgi:hypothetical protein